MSRRGRAGKQSWRDRQPADGQELADEITARAAEQQRRWAEQGRMPGWIRAKARLRGWRATLPGRDGAR
jgi:hypothetical protein